ncbi:MAG: hypothetical protein ACRCVG_03205, partial [Methanobacteriaceae archaeon]
MSKKILLVSSPGGHFVELSLLNELLDQKKTVIVSTYLKKPKLINCESYYSITDFNRNNGYKIIGVIYQSYKILRRENPALVITTGAAPGLIMLIISKLFRINTLWIDSIANTKELSLSGKFAKFLGINVISQWP